MRPSTLLTTLLLSFISLTASLSPPFPSPPQNSPWKSHTQIPAPAATGPSTPQLISSSFGLDAPKLDHINTTSYEWWYFDVVSPDQQYSLIIVFFAAPEDGFPLSLAPKEDITVVCIALTTPDSDERFAAYVNASAAEIWAVGEGASGNWRNSGFSFTGAPDLSRYVVNIDSPGIGVKGQVTFESIAPAHYVCSPAVGGQNMEVLPHIGWTNAIPDAQAHVELTVNGEEICFSGAGYHDMNWGDSPFALNIAGWIWGHGRLGPYSLVWFDGFSPHNQQQRTGFYISLNNTILANACTGISVTPVAKHGKHKHDFFIEADLGEQGLGVFQANLTLSVITLDQDVFSRFTGTLRGGFVGGEVYEGGSALYEVFDLESWELVRQA